jgi:hypothetical protein
MADEKSFNVAGRRLMVAIPAYDGKLNIKSAFALANLAMQTAQAGVTLYLTQVSGCSLITKARNMLVADFLASDATDLLFVDADVIITADDVMRLLALSGDKDITAGAYPRRSKDKKFFTDLHFTDGGKLEFADGMLRVKRIGTGFMLIRRHVLETLRDRHPEWRCYNNVLERDEHAIFDFQIKDGEYYGEDYTFCNRAAEEGFTVHLDTDINLPHVGTEEFASHFGEEVLKPLIEHYGVGQ